MRACLMVCVLAVLAAAPAGGAAPRPGEAAGHVQDLHYGDVLFHYYQEDDFEALTRLLAYEHWSACRTTRTIRTCWSAACTLILGLYNEAGAIFESVLTMDVPTGVRNRAWFYLGQVWYARGYLDKADEALRKIRAHVAGSGGAEGSAVANALMRQGHFDEAIAAAHGLPRPAALAGLRALQPRRGTGARQAHRRGRHHPERRRHPAALHHGAAGTARPRQSGAGIRLSAGQSAGTRRACLSSACA